MAQAHTKPESMARRGRTGVWPFGRSGIGREEGRKSGSWAKEICSITSTTPAPATATVASRRLTLAAPRRTATVTSRRAPVAAAEKVAPTVTGWRPKFRSRWLPRKTQMGEAADSFAAVAKESKIGFATPISDLGEVLGPSRKISKEG